MVQNCVNYWHHVLYVSEGSNHVTATWKKDFFPLFVCLFIFFAIRISRFFFSSYFFCYPNFFPSAFFHPHFPIRIRHPQVSGPRFTDTPIQWPSLISMFLKLGGNINRYLISGFLIISIVLFCFFFFNIKWFLIIVKFVGVDQITYKNGK